MLGESGDRCCDSFFFFGGLPIPLSQAILAHMFSYNISWSATIKEVQRSNFFKEIPKIAKRYVFRRINRGSLGGIDGNVQVLVPDVGVYCSYCRHDCLCDESGAAAVESGWEWVVCDFSCLVSFFDLRLSIDKRLIDCCVFIRILAGCHILFPVRIHSSGRALLDNSR